MIETQKDLPYKEVLFEEYVQHNTKPNEEVLVQFSYTNINYNVIPSMSGSDKVYVDFQYSYKTFSEALSGVLNAKVMLPTYTLEESLVVHYTNAHKQELIDRWLLKREGEVGLDYTDVDGLDEYCDSDDSLAGVLVGSHFDYSQTDY